jgi:ABC-type uncharacterized transport system permease subunit
MNESVKFYSKFAWFSIQEEQSSLSSIISGCILYPCFVWIFSKLWLGLNHNFSTLGQTALFAYIGLTEILFLTTLREAHTTRASSDFSISFVRPRNWSFYTSVWIYARTLYRRLLYLIIYVLIMPLFTLDFAVSSYSALRFLLVLPISTLLDSLYSFVLTCLQIRFYSIKSFRLLFGKLFLIFGGVLAPLSDLPAPWDKFFLNTPFSDLIFQSCYFSIQGEFYQMSGILWIFRISLQLVCLLGLCAFCYRNARKYYHNFGG